MEMPADMVSLFSEEMAAKYLATLDGQGNPNVAVIVTLQPPAGRTDRLIFGEFLMWKSREYLQQDPRVAACVVSLKLKTGALVGDFQGFEKTGANLEQINSSGFMRYNAYTGARMAGVLDVKETFPVRNIGYAGVARDLLGLAVEKYALRDGRATGTVEIPPIVESKFKLPAAVKAIAVRAGDGYPRIYPIMAMAPAGKGLLAFKIAPYNRELATFETPRAAACAVLTMDAISYKLKGTLVHAGKGTGLLAVEEVYNASPPRAGDRIR